MSLTSAMIIGAFYAVTLLVIVCWCMSIAV